MDVSSSAHGQVFTHVLGVERLDLAAREIPDAHVTKRGKDVDSTRHLMALEGLWVEPDGDGLAKPCDEVLVDGRVRPGECYAAVALGLHLRERSIGHFVGWVYGLTALQCAVGISPRECRYLPSVGELVEGAFPDSTFRHAPRSSAGSGTGASSLRRVEIGFCEFHLDGVLGSSS